MVSKTAPGLPQKTSTNKGCLKTLLIVLLLVLLSLFQVYSDDLRLSAVYQWTVDSLASFQDDDPANSTSTSNITSITLLSCEKYGGPPDEIAREMVYWRDTPSDTKFVSPFQNAGPKIKYLTFELDEGGWNNIRMATETAVAMAFAMGRTLVLPPTRAINAMDIKSSGGQKNVFSLTDLISFDSMQRAYPHFEIITFEEFLLREAMTGNMRDKTTGLVSFPPNNQTNFNGLTDYNRQKELNYWIRSVTVNPIWNCRRCVTAFAAGPGAQAVTRLPDIVKEAWNQRAPRAVWPTPVNATPAQRLREMMAHRTSLCIYDEAMQNTTVIHLMGDFGSGARLLVHFYVFLFFENWRQDLWTKRFLRDHFRYVDEIQCAAARVVHAVREKSRENGNGGVFDSLHIRRGDFLDKTKYKSTSLSSEGIFNNTIDLLEPNSTIYIATSDRNKTFFDIFRQRYHVYFLDDFADLVTEINTNLYGMLDQRIASRGRVFVGTYLSTFTGYINRLKGYHSQVEKTEGYERGVINSFYFSPEKHKHAYREYQSVVTPIWTREFPVAWRDIDQGLDVNDEALYAG